MFISNKVMSHVISSQWLPESPRFHLVSGQPRRAWRTLELAARLNKSSLPEGKLHAKVEVGISNTEFDMPHVNSQKSNFNQCVSVTYLILLSKDLYCCLK